MIEPTNKERLGKIETGIDNLNANFKEFKDDYKESDIRRWKSINKNTEDIASQKSVIRIIEGLLIGAYVSLVGLFIGKFR